MKLKFKDLNTGDVVFERTLLPGQEKFWKSDKRYILYSGGFGSGKTMTMILRCIYECMSQDNNYFLMGRKTYQEIYDILLKDFLEICHPSWIVSYKKSPHPSVILKTFNGKTSEIIFRNLDRMSQAEIRGLNLGGFAVDQAEDIDENIFQDLTSRLRRQNIKHRVFLTCNPALTWLYRVVKQERKEGWELIEASSKENYKNLPQTTIEIYESYPESYYKQYVLGIWDENLLADSIVFAREHIAKMEINIQKPIREFEGLRIYKEYIDGHEYQMGVDPAEGGEDTENKRDNASVCIVDINTLEEVASWAGKIPPDFLAEKCVIWAQEYSKHFPQCMIIPEMNSIGLAFVNKLRDLGWSRIYQREEIDKKNGTKTEKLGWRTTSSTKPLLVSRFQELLRVCEPKIYTEETIAEFKTFIYSDEVKKRGMGAQSGFHDDRIMSTLLAFWKKGKIIKSEILNNTTKNKQQSFLKIIKGRARMVSPYLEIGDPLDALSKKWTTK